MAKYLKRYNEESKKWEVVSAPDVTVIHEIEGGTKIPDTDVVVTNYNYSGEEGISTLDDTLSTISEDIARLQRNVSWLGEHGGGGGGGNTGGVTTYGIEIISPLIEDNVVYVSTESFTVKFKVTGGTDSDDFQYHAIYDGVDATGWLTAKNEEDKTVVIADINSVSDSSVHQFQLEVKTPIGTTLRKAFRIYENSLKLYLSERNTSINGEVILTMGGNGNVYFNVKNGILNSNTTLKFSLSNGTSDTVSYENDSTSATEVSVPIWKIIDQNTVQENDLYIITIYAQATYGVTVNNRTEDIVFPVRIRNTNRMSIYFDGLSYDTDDEHTRVELNGRLKFNFRVYPPTLITDTSIYYAIKLISPFDEEYFVAGETFDDNRHSENVPDKSGKYISVQIPLASYYISDGWRIIVKAWVASDKTVRDTKVGMFDIIATNLDMFPRQHGKRSITQGSASADTCLYAWDSFSIMKDDAWISSIHSYMIQGDYGPMVEKSVQGTITTYNTNGRSSGFIVSEEVPYLRLQNEAYAIADMSGELTEIQFMTNLVNDEGFDISVTFKADDAADTTKTVFLWGSNDGNGNLLNGVKITMSEAIWEVHGDGGTSKTLKANVRQGKKTTVDFLYKGGNCYIFVDGIINEAFEVTKLDQTSSFQFKDKAYFATNLVNGEFTDFADVNIYEFAVYTKALNPLQIAVNGKNARLNGQISNEAILEDYREWKRKNLIYNIEGSENKALSYLIDGNGAFNQSVSVAELEAASPIPIVMLDANGTSLDHAYFHADYGDNPGIKDKWITCNAQIYDKGNTLSFKADIAIQGTSTLSYYVKNLEMKVADRSSEDPQKTKLLQVKDTWFPENEYTLKADIVDSAHANNATIGYWINNECKLMEPNPAIENFKDATRPKDVQRSGEPAVFHADTRTATLGQEIDFDEKVTIKHNLEGFPVLLLIRFADSTQGYELIGIYSFNLGRYSYYNMGLKFLKEYARNEVLPALVDHYIEYGKDEGFGDDGIKASEIFSYEFNANADDNDPNHQTWTQDHPSVLQFYGDFNYNGAGQDPRDSVGTNDPIWSKLQNLFNRTATMGGNTSSLNSLGFGGKERYISNGKVLVPAGGNPYNASENAMQNFDALFSINNAVAYFVITSAFGMVDSLGKNLTLRTWDNGNKWWVCFYDMDTALGISNEGDEGISSTEFIDTYSNVIDGTTNLTKLSVVAHDQLSKYGGKCSKLWAILRDPLFIRLNDSVTYNALWTTLRTRGGALSSHENFISLLEDTIGSCGELIYDYDYDTKYIGPGQNLAMLHGNRIEYIRNWLKQRLYFFDGVFEDENASIGNFVDSPFYINKFNMTSMGRDGYIPFFVKATTPVFVKMNTGNVDDTNNIDDSSKYYIPAGTITEIHTPPHTSVKQTAVSSSRLLTVFDGLDTVNVTSLNRNQGFNQYEVLTSLVEFNISGSHNLQDDPIVFQRSAIDKNGVFMRNGESALEKIDVSNTAFADPVNSTTFNVYLADYQKLKYIDISDSPVSNLTLPASILQYLNVSYSKINSFYMQNQPVLKSVNFTGCTNLYDVNIDNCNGLTGLTCIGIRSLGKVTVNACAGIENITITGSPYLTEVTINGCKSLKTLIISGCTNAGLTVNVTTCTGLENVTIDGCTGANFSLRINDGSLKDITLRSIESPNIIHLPDSEKLTGVTNLVLDNVYNFGGFRYGEEEAETLGGEMVVNLSPMTSLEEITFRNLRYVKYVRVRNSGDPVRVGSSAFEDCTSLRRVFGYIEITGPGVFSNKIDFKLNDDGIKNTDYNYNSWHDKEVIEFFEGDYDTNIKISAQDISSVFSRTDCSLGDVYYVFGMIGTGVTNITSMFRNCNNISLAGMIDDKTEEVIQEGFTKYCINVTGVSNLFNGCGNFHGRISAFDMHMLSKNAVEFDAVFPDGLWYDNSEGLFAANNHIETIANFNPKFSESSHGDIFERYQSRAITASTMLDGLDNIKVIRNAFNAPSGEEEGSQIIFSAEGNINNVHGHMEGITYCELLRGKTGLTTIENSFNNLVIGGGDVVRGLICDPNHLNDYSKFLQTITNSFNFAPRDPYCAMLFGDSMFASCKNAISNISNSFGGDILKLIDVDDCNDLDFPYRIFSGLTYIEDVSNFFEGFIISPFIKYDYDLDVPSDQYAARIVVEPRTQALTLPTFTQNGETHSMFETNLKLKKVSALFKNMYFGEYRLTPYGFRNNSIEFANDIFSEFTYTGNTDDPKVQWEPYKARKVGQIPYGLFYQEKDGIINPTIKNIDAAFEGTSGNSLDVYTMDTSSDNIADYLEMSDTGKYVWNKYLHDGTTAFKNKAMSLMSANPSIVADTAHYDLTLPTEVDENEYDETDTMDKIIPRHTGFAGNGTSDYIDWIKVNIFNKRNYFCPPDLFRYCKNQNVTSAAAVFRRASHGIANGWITGEATTYGYHGRIPSFLLEPISDIETLDSMFSGFKLIIPERWSTYRNNEIITTGIMYPGIFKPLKGLKYLRSFFEYGTIWGDSVVSDMFGQGQGNTLLEISKLWSWASWVGGESLIDAQLFSYCVKLQNVSGMFEYSGPKTMYASLFNSSQSTIANCSNFMKNSFVAGGTLVPFWDFPNMTYYSGCYYGVSSVFDSYIEGHTAYFSQ